ncbi:UNVERIFIED_CONTAM: hypothetical protein PYX00_010855 [Menopon gallinae]|uniref:LysM domain-containing protein n=1 Tax=Menopon gallinae TaxID=328185 RepID=A0AAW2H6G3_9NEOP
MILSPSLTIKESKRFMASSHRYEILGRQIDSQEVATHILRKLKEEAEAFLKELVSGVVVTVPAYFNEEQRKATRQAIIDAGLEPKRILNEPTAAALAYAVKAQLDGNILVYDLGGGTFDVTILRKQGQEYKLEEMVEKIKIELSSLEEVSVSLPFAMGTAQAHNWTYTLTREEFNHLIRPLVHQTLNLVKKALKEASLQENDIDTVILSGGSTRVPLVQQALSELFMVEFKASINPDEVVALGAGVLVGMLTSELGKQITFNDVVTLPLGVEIEEGCFVLKRNPQDVNFEIKIAFEVNEDGLLSVSAFCPATGESRQLSVLPKMELNNETLLMELKADIQTSWQMLKERKDLTQEDEAVLEEVRLYLDSSNIHTQEPTLLLAGDQQDKQEQVLKPNFILADKTYTMKAGDTLSLIAVLNSVSVETLISYNDISDVKRLRAGDKIKIPNMNGILHIVKAGRVIVVSVHPEFGKYIIIEHGSGYQTLYGHLNDYEVNKGQYVNRGQLIARMGNTGYSTGVHLHFSVYKNAGSLTTSKALLKEIKSARLIIAIDGGLSWAFKLGLVPDCVIGDLDSLEFEDLKQAESLKIPIYRYPQEKDYTDTELAFKKAKELGASSLILLGALGGQRIEHTLANILLFLQFQDIPWQIIDAQVRILLLRPSQRLYLQGKKGDLLSLLPLSVDVTGLRGKGLSYELNGLSLKMGEARGEVASQLIFYRSLHQEDTHLAEVARLSFEKKASTWEVLISRDEISNRLYLYAKSDVGEERSTDLAFENLSNVPSWDRKASSNFILDDEAFKDYEVLLPEFFSEENPSFSELVGEESSFEEPEALDDSALEKVLDEALKDEGLLGEEELGDRCLELEEEDLLRLIDLSLEDIVNLRSQEDVAFEETKEGKADFLPDEEEELSLEEVLKTLDTPFPSPLDETAPILEEQAQEVLDKYEDKGEEEPFSSLLSDSSFQSFLESLENEPLYDTFALNTQEQETSGEKQEDLKEESEFTLKDQVLEEDAFKDNILKSLEEEAKNLCEKDLNVSLSSPLENWGTFDTQKEESLTADLSGKNPDTEWEESNLEESNLEESNLEESNLEESNLEESNLEESNLEESNLEESNLEESNLEESNLEESNLEESNLEESNLEESNLEESNLEESNLEESNLEESNLEESNLEESNLEESNLEESNLEESNLEESNLEESNLEESNLEESNLEESNLEESNLEESNLEESNLEESNLEESNLEESNLEESNLEESNLEESNLEESNLEESNLEESNLEESNLEESNLEESNLEESNLEESNLEESNLEESNLEESNLEESNLEESNLEESNLEENSISDFTSADLLLSEDPVSQQDCQDLQKLTKDLQQDETQQPEQERIDKLSHEAEPRELALSSWSDLSSSEKDFLKSLTFEDIAFVLSPDALPRQNLDEDIHNAMMETVKVFNFEEEAHKSNEAEKKEPKDYSHSFIFMGGCTSSKEVLDEKLGFVSKGAQLFQSPADWLWHFDGSLESLRVRCALPVKQMFYMAYKYAQIGYERRFEETLLYTLDKTDGLVAKLSAKALLEYWLTNRLYDSIAFYAPAWIKRFKEPDFQLLLAQAYYWQGNNQLAWDLFDETASLAKLRLGDEYYLFNTVLALRLAKLSEAQDSYQQLILTVPAGALHQRLWDYLQLVPQEKELLASEQIKWLEFKSLVWKAKESKALELLSTLLKGEYKEYFLSSALIGDFIGLYPKKEVPKGDPKEQKSYFYEQAMQADPLSYGSLMSYYFTGKDIASLWDTLEKNANQFAWQTDEELNQVFKGFLEFGLAKPAYALFKQDYHLLSAVNYLHLAKLLAYQALLLALAHFLAKQKKERLPSTLKTWAFMAVMVGLAQGVELISLYQLDTYLFGKKALSKKNTSYDGVEETNYKNKALEIYKAEGFSLDEEEEEALIHDLEEAKKQSKTKEESDAKCLEYSLYGEESEEALEEELSLKKHYSPKPHSLTSRHSLEEDEGAIYLSLKDHNPLEETFEKNSKPYFQETRLTSFKADNAQKSKSYDLRSFFSVAPRETDYDLTQENQKEAQILKKTLQEFNIEAEVVGIYRGPVVTTFEILPAQGIKLSRITSLADNLALRLAAPRLRILAPIPGKEAVGIELPNKIRDLVSLAELFNSEVYTRTPMSLPFALGKTVMGQVRIFDLARAPHLLIAGATGADAKKAMQVMQWCVREMEKRYQLLDSVGTRDIISFNQKVKEQNLALAYMPYLVIIMDEFADLMMLQGAEQLLGKGDMLLSVPWLPYPERLQGAFLSENELEEFIDKVKSFGEPEYLDDEIFEHNGEIEEDFYEEDDPLYFKAVEIVTSEKKASASYLQRRLKIGYNRAARFIECMENQGIIGPQQGAKPREILQ